MVALLVVALVVFGERQCGRGVGLLRAAAAAAAAVPHRGAEQLQRRARVRVVSRSQRSPVAAALRKATLRRWLVFGGAAGLAVAQRPNGLFLPFVVLPFLLRAWLRPNAADGFQAPSCRHSPRASPSGWSR